MVVDSAGPLNNRTCRFSDTIRSPQLLLTKLFKKTCETAGFEDLIIPEVSNSGKCLVLRVGDALQNYSHPLLCQ